MNAQSNRKVAAVLAGVLWIVFLFQCIWPLAIEKYDYLLMNWYYMSSIASIISGLVFFAVSFKMSESFIQSLIRLLPWFLALIILLAIPSMYYWFQILNLVTGKSQIPYDLKSIVMFLSAPILYTSIGLLAATQVTRWPLIFPLCIVLTFLVAMLSAVLAVLPGFNQSDFGYVYAIVKPAAFIYAAWAMSKDSSKLGTRIKNILAQKTSAGVMLRKEFRLQKNNIMLAASAILLGMLGIFVVPHTAPRLGSFSAEDIRSAVLFCFMLPTLIGILPLMIGCTAAASERALEVNRWQAALPVSWRRTIGIKIVAIATLCLIIGGVLPYILALMGDSYGLLNNFFRGSWTGWLAFLMTAIGFYGGSIARNDYHGLLLALFPASVVLAGMALADPYHQVFPLAVTLEQDFWKPFGLILRLMLLFSLLIFLAAGLMRRQEQIRKSRLATHAALLLILTFTTTLINFTHERQMIEDPLDRQANYTISFSREWDTVYITTPRLAGSLKGLKERNVSIYLEQDQQASRDFAVGSVVRTSRNRLDDSSHPFVVTDLHLREFPQALSGVVVKASPNQHWILAQRDKPGYTLCGPCNLAIASWMMPDSVFWRLSNLLGVKELDADYQLARTKLSILTTGTYLVSMKRPYNKAGSEEKQYSATLSDHWDEDAGTSITYQFSYSAQWSRIKLMNRDLLYAPFIEKGEVRIGSKVIGSALSVNQGVAVIDLGTGKETLHRFNNPITRSYWDESWNTQGFLDTRFCWHPSGAVAGYTRDYLTALIPSSGTWDSGINTVRAKITLQKNWLSAVFAGRNAIVISNGQELQIINLPW